MVLLPELIGVASGALSLFSALILASLSEMSQSSLEYADVKISQCK